ncbi:hypothetical protein LRP67_02730 [Nocardioides sp. cx-169]|uniref:hypothetical protein n=1 Tax=Nocardioides sp. cx-169 TaxID=2899080 RepID=UPI001E2F83CB|nr:hypothetical protein [Nocardioides sp. cx-169]MCD4532996.1 hypothetical protein [Nocardioides sp. cx-169]
MDGRRADVDVADGRVVAIAAPGVLPTQAVALRVHGRGGALLPGLHDHLHLLATAARLESVDCGPPATGRLDALRRRLQAARDALPADGWIRGVNYQESVAGEVGDDLLDELTGETPARVQHRSGALWMLNSVAWRIVEPGLVARLRGTGGRVTRESLVLTLAVLGEVGAAPGDRIEHGAVVPTDLHESMRELALRVVTQPDFLRTRGTTYLRDVAPTAWPCSTPIAAWPTRGSRRRRPVTRRSANCTRGRSSGPPCSGGPRTGWRSAPPRR